MCNRAKDTPGKHGSRIHRAFLVQGSTSQPLELSSSAFLFSLFFFATFPSPPSTYTGLVAIALCIINPVAPRPPPSPRPGDDDGLDRQPRTFHKCSVRGTSTLALQPPFLAIRNHHLQCKCPCQEWRIAPNMPGHPFSDPSHTQRTRHVDFVSQQTITAPTT